MITGYIMNELQQTSQYLDEVISDQDLKMLQKVPHIRHNLIQFVNLDKVIDIISNYINTSDYINFSSTRSSRYTTKKNMTFRIKVMVTAYLNDHESRRIGDVTALKELRESIILDEVITPFTDYLFKEIETITNSDEGGNLEFLKLGLDITQVRQFILPSMFSIIIENKNDDSAICYLKFIL